MVSGGVAAWTGESPRMSRPEIKMKKELVYIRAVTLICFLFGVLGIAAALVTNSSSMLFDGMYSMVQSVFILLSGFVVSLIGRKDDEYYQFGYGAFEPFYIVIRTVVLLAMNTILASGAIESIREGGRRVEATVALAFTAISIVGCLIVYVLLRREGKRLNSPILRAESKSWLNDTLISVSVLISFGIMAVLDHFGYSNIANMIDPVITIMFALSLLPSLLKQLISSVKDLLEAAPPKEAQERLEKVVLRYSDIYGFKDYEIYSSKHGRTISATIHIVLREDLSVRTIDGIRKSMLKDIISQWQWSDTDIVFTIDPSWMEYAVPSPQGAEIVS